MLCNACHEYTRLAELHIDGNVTARKVTAYVGMVDSDKRATWNCDSHDHEILKG